jgi:hypothetical protein
LPPVASPQAVLEVRMTAISVVNKSTLVTDSDVELMTRACAAQLELHAAPLWGLAPIPVTYRSSEQDAAPGEWVIAVLDDGDQANALGWHTEDQGDLIYGRVFARPVLDNGGDATSKPLSVASVLSHETLEAFCDPHVNLWADRGDGTLIAVEVCDPVESDSYPIQVTTGTTTTEVTVSNFVTPHWFDPKAAGADAFDFLRKATGPFAMTAGGYWVQMTGSEPTQQFGPAYAEWRRHMKDNDPLGRGARRMRRRVQ